MGHDLDINLVVIRNLYFQYWLIDNVDIILERAKELGSQLYRGPLKVNEIKRTIMQIKDPFGNIIGFESPMK